MNETKPQNLRWIHSPGERSFSRADQVLKIRLPALSGRIGEELFRSQRIRVNSRVVKKGSPVGPGDAVEVELPGPLQPFPIPEACFKLQIHFRDESLLVVEKPGSVHTHPLSPFETGALANVLVSLWPELMGIGTKPLEPGLVHRLDQGTSGLVVVARNQAVWQQLKKDLAAKGWQKLYHSLVHGLLDRPQTLKFPLSHDPSDTRRMKIITAGEDSGRGKRYRARTEVTPIGTFSGYTLVKVNLVTGVTHQIRVHLAHLGHPIVGDRLYGKKEGLSLRLNPNRLFLHASRLSLPHPVTREILTVSSDLPEDLRVLLSSIP